MAVPESKVGAAKDGVIELKKSQITVQLRVELLKDGTGLYLAQHLDSIPLKFL